MNPSEFFEWWRGVSEFGPEWDSFTHRIVATMAHFLWQGLVVGLVGFAISRLIVDGSRSLASVRYALLTACLLTLPVCCVVTFALLSPNIDKSNQTAFVSPAGLQGNNDTTYQPIGSAQVERKARPAPPSIRGKSELVGAAEVVEHDSNASTPVEQAAWYENYSSSLVVAYLIGVVTLLARLLQGTLGCARVKRKLAPLTSGPIFESLMRQVEIVGLKRAPQLAIVDSIAVPVVVGVLKPVVLLPSSLVCGLDIAQIEAILTHELAHIHRYDPIVNLAQRGVEALLFFHPITWWLSRQISTEREHCCDDIAAGHTSDLHFAESLLRMAELCSNGGSLRIESLNGLAATGRGNHLSWRIQRLLKEPQPVSMLPSLRSLLLIPLLSCVLVSGVLAIAQEAEELEPSISSNEISEASDLSDPKSDETKSNQKSLKLDPVTVVSKSGEIVWGEKSKDGWRTGVRVVRKDAMKSSDLVLEYVLKNESEERREIEINFSSGPARLHLVSNGKLDSWGGTLGSRNSIEKFVVDAGAAYSSTTFREVFDFSGFAEGEYELRLNSYFSVKGRGAVWQGLPLSESLSLLVVHKGPRENAAGNPISNSIDPNELIHWGPASSGMRIGAKLLGANTPTHPYPLDSSVKARLFVQNVSDRDIPCVVLLPHSMDGWTMTVEDAKGKSIDRDQVFISAFEPQRTLTKTLKPGEIAAFTGENTTFAPDENLGATAKDVEFRIQRQAVKEQYRPPFVYELEVGKYQLTLSGLFRREDMPGASISLKAGSVPFRVFEDNKTAIEATTVKQSSPEEDTKSLSTNGEQQSSLPTHAGENRKAQETASIDKPGVAAGGTGTVTGRVHLDKPLATRPTIQVLPNGLPNFGHFPTEKQKAQISEALVEIDDPSLVVGDDLGLANVFVWLNRLPDDYKQPQVSLTPAYLDLLSYKTMTPRAMVVQTGQDLIFRNLHDHMSNFRMQPFAASSSNVMLSPGDSVTLQEHFSKPEFPIDVRSDLMGKHACGWILPVDHPFAAVTDENGRFKIEGLPPGKHRLKVWHERRGSLPDVTVEVSKDRAVAISVVVPSSQFKLGAGNKSGNTERMRWFAEGYVKDAQGNPMKDVEIWVHSGIGSLRGGVRGKTDTNGYYKVQFTQGMMMFQNSVSLQYANVTAHAKGFSEANLNQHGAGAMALRQPPAEELKNFGVDPKSLALPSKTRRVDFVMVPARRIEGQLVGNGTFSPASPKALRDSDAAVDVSPVEMNRRPLKGWRVWLTGPELPPASSVFASAVTDEDGKFVFEDVPTGFEWQFQSESHNSHRSYPISKLFKLSLDSSKLRVELSVDEKQEAVKLEIQN